VTRQAPKAHEVELTPPAIACWARSETGVAYVHERASGKFGPEVLITALVHGNEYSGAMALDAWLASGLLPRYGRVTAVFCNTDAFARFDKAHPDASRFIDEDLNRVWSPTRLDGAGEGCELQRARQIRPLVERATHLLDLHSMHEPGEPLLVTGLLPRNIAFAQSLGTACQVIIDEGHADGVRMRDYGPFSDPAGSRIALLLEAGQHWQRNSLSVARNVLMRFLAACGVVTRADVPAGWLLPDAPPPQPITVTHRVIARTMSFAFVQDFTDGEIIRRAGTTIALDDDEPVVTPYDDCVLVMPSVRQLRPGVTTARLGKVDI
jgi:predicted deacylase